MADYNKNIADIVSAIQKWEEGGSISTLKNALNLLNETIYLLEKYPEFDDRNLWFRTSPKRVYLDIDGVLGDFEQHFLKYLNLDLKSPDDWNDWRFRTYFEQVAHDEKFWMTIPPIVQSKDIVYPIAGYCTSRPIDDKVTLAWLEENGFPMVDFINVKDKKKSVFLSEKCDVFIDDGIYNFIDCQKNQINCYLMTRPHNTKYNAGLWRINSFGEFMDKLVAV